MTAQEIDRIECAIRHITSSLDVDPWARDIAVKAMQKQIHPGGDEMNDRDCENCAHHTGGSCSVWECSYEPIGDDTISRQAAVDAICGVCQADCIPCEFDTPSRCGMVKAVQALPSAQPTQTDTSNTLKSLDCVERQAAIDAVVSICDSCDSSYCGDCRVNFPGVKDARKALEDLPSAQPEWNNHTVACLLAELFDDDCACNYNGIDEWLPEKCEVIDSCPNPVGVACWEQYLKHRAERREK